MRIAGDTIRRSYLSRYEKNYSDKYDSEKKIYSGRQFDRASESPIEAARALRVRKTISEVETYEKNLETANSIYTNAESAMLTVSTIIQSVYEKLVEGAHGTRNQNDLDIIAMDIDNYAEEMVQSFNIDIADRKVFGGVNNETVAFKIEGSGNSKYVTYNGVAVNSTNDYTAFPQSQSSYLDIGIGLSVNGATNRIDDQSALPITFNGAECTGCGMTSKTASIDLGQLIPGSSYTFNISAGGKARQITFTADNGGSRDKNIENINNLLGEAFLSTAEAKDDGTLVSSDGNQMKLIPYEPSPIEDGKIKMSDIKDDTYYSMTVSMNGMTRVVDFLGSTDPNIKLKNMDDSLKKAFGERAYADSTGTVHYGVSETAVVKSRLDEIEQAPVDTATNTIDYGALEPGKTYAINVSNPKVNGKGEPQTDDDGNVIYEEGKMVYFTAGDTQQDTIDAINKYIKDNEVFGDVEAPYLDENGVIHYDVDGANIVIDSDARSQEELPYTEIDGYPNNLIQLVLDAAKLLRKGDQDMVARYADLVFAAQSNLSIAISDLGTHAKFIEFNQDRLADVKVNLMSQQNDIESTDLPSEITQWKVLESVYNASLQMGSSVLSQSIFNYIS